MTASGTLASLLRRLRLPGAWGAVLASGALWSLLRWSTGPSHATPGEMAFPFIFGLGVMALSPLPWQWSGREGEPPGFLRGLLQALPFNVLLLGLMTPFLAGHPGRGTDPLLPFLPVLSPRMLGLLAACGAFSLLAGWLWAARDHAAAQAETQARLAREAQTLALQAQMNPHVLFNLLGSLAELSHERPAEAEPALLQLADFLRRLLDHCARPLVPLGEERVLVEGYLALEALRLGDRLRVTWQWDEALEDLEVPPLLLQPLVENAVKHGIAPSAAGGEVVITLAGSPGTLRLEVANTGRPYAPTGPGGRGLANLTQRLDLLDRWQGRLDLGPRDGRTLATLRLEARHD